jgi:DNA-binding NarL/FixJ family response regulator
VVAAVKPNQTVVRAPVSAPSRPTLSIDLTLADLSSPVVETCSALSLSLHEGDVDAAERLFGFVVDQMPDQRSALTDVLAPLITDQARLSAALGGRAVFVESCSRLLSRLRRPAATQERSGVLLHSPEIGVPSLRLQLLALLLDEVQVPVWLLLGTDEQAVRDRSTSRRLAAACLAADDPDVLRRKQPLIRSMRALGTSVVLMSDDVRTETDLAHEIGASAATGRLGEAADLLLLARGPMTAAEAEVLRLAADGYTNTRIAHELGISVSAVKARLECAFVRLGAADRAHAVAIALRQRWIV